MQMSNLIQVASSWPGFSELSYLIIFGDSYSSVGYDLAPKDYVSTAMQPLGVPFPGSTWNEPDLPNWVGHLITKYFPRSQFTPGGVEQDVAYLEHPLLVYDYAKGGDTVTGLRRQIQSRYLPNVGQKPDWASWSSENSLFITWIGINDCAFSKDHVGNLKNLFSLQEELYDSGARNFLFIDVPPIHRSPAGEKHFFFFKLQCVAKLVAHFVDFAVPKHREDSTTFDNFNNELNAAAHAFAAKHSAITVMLFSASATFTRILDAPKEYGFRDEDCRRPGGRIWIDRLHPTSAVHDCVAKDLTEFLGRVGSLQV